MKRGGCRHPKVKRLATSLGIPVVHAIGILEVFWSAVAEYRPNGDVTSFEDWWLKELCGWDRGDSLVLALISAGFIDKIGNKLLAHNWKLHAPPWVRTKLHKNGIPFAVDQETFRPVVYFIATSDGARVKIGYTTRQVSDRLQDLQTSSADRLKVVATIHGTQEDEAAFHAKFAQFRLFGEWFSFSDEIKSFIAEAKREQDQ